MSLFVKIGQISVPHGVQGWLKVVPATDEPDIFLDIEKVMVLKKDGTGRNELAIEGVKFQATRVLLKFEGIDDRDQAGLLRGCEIQIPEEQLPVIEEEDVYYHYQLEGMLVKDKEGNDLGNLEAVIQAGGNDVYVVKSPDGKKEYMVPAMKRCVLEVDVQGKVMVVDRAWVV
ncbi:MAG TPA: ribosome maturation factor RimM [bacterium]|mgnify:CR=1 FL=1|nr:ribosome maturation factor RimM [bacterium]